GFGLGPALLITQDRERAGDARATLARGRRGLRRGLVAAQLALTVVLLVSSGLLVVSFSNLVRREVGFRDPEGLVTARAPLSGRRYEGPVAQRQFYEALLARSAALPGVRGAALVAPLDADSPPVVYLSHLQAAENRMMLVLRTELGVASVTNQIRGIVKTLDAGIPVYAVTTLDQQLSDSKAVFIRRFPMMLCGVFAAAAL